MSSDEAHGADFNPFTGPEVATRYARARPPLHGHVVQTLKRHTSPVERAVDLGCGTGLSTRPLSSIAGFVVGIDISDDMLAVAERFEQGAFVAAATERLPFADGTFGVGTISSAIHWFGPEGLHEVDRVLAPDAILAVYDVWFVAEMVDVPAFADWMHDVCGPRYAQVPKRHENIDLLGTVGFERSFAEDTRHEVTMTIDQLIDYLMTHSERIAAVRTGVETEEEQRAFLSDGLGPFFESGSSDVLFGVQMEVYTSTSS